LASDFHLSSDFVVIDNEVWQPRNFVKSAVADDSNSRLAIAAVVATSPSVIERFPLGGAQRENGECFYH
jgi:hypothetical protein